jgi:ubiquinone/menaquinone biosynthesis C-methylase UbiE
MDAKAHWEQVYTTKAPTQVSWHQEHLSLSLQLIQRTGMPRTGQLIDVGGGTSTLVDDLLAAGFHSITVLDISATALQLARARLGPRASAVTWIEADITQAVFPDAIFDVWHDRAVFHFLTQPTDRQRYVDRVRDAVRPGGYVIVASFAPDGPQRCSGLDVMRYSPDSMHHEFGPRFALIDSASEIHHTPFGTEQKFIYCFCRRQ